MTDKEYIEKANKLLKMAYVPYSHFPVAAIVIDANGNEYYGVNVENAAYNVGLCAERNAITNGITKGLAKISKIYITANTDRPVSPCGACRQVISEFSDENTVLILGSSESEELKKFKINEILPYSFGPNDL
ncbi:cytidine deaminase [Caviibacter abscessus]|uniref:cytidine deaminase n=1 Tax=Caviibacter abscessus TaxID=1766719 RepID=UPI0008349BA6|nr:cytidine deaminase [Caviibacter abscessus]